MIFAQEGQFISPALKTHTFLVRTTEAFLLIVSRQLSNVKDIQAKSGKSKIGENQI